MIAEIPENLDRPAYEILYRQEYYALDVGYQLLSSFSRDVLDLSFDHFWLALLLVQFFLLAAAYNLPSILIGYPTLLALAGPLFGTQVRYGLASIILMLCLTHARAGITRVATAALASVVHLGTILPGAVLLISAPGYPGRSQIVRRISLILMLSAFFLGLDWLLSVTRFGYYAETRVGQGKSIQSLIYAVCYLAYLGFAIRLAPSLRENVAIGFGVNLLISVVATSFFIVVSGRLLILFMLVEPLIILSIFRCNDGRAAWYGAAGILLSTSKLLTYVH